MNDIKNITDKILADAQLFADEVKENALKRAEQTVSSYRAQADSAFRDAVERAKREAADNVSRAESARRLKERNLLLAAKCEILDEVFEKAAERIINLPSDEYINLLIKCFKTAADDRDTVILLNGRDLKAVGQRFFAEASRIFSEKFKNRTLELSPVPVQIDGGFILKSGDIEINATVKSLLSSLRKSHENDIFKLLFD